MARFAAFQELTPAELGTLGLSRRDCARSLRFVGASGRVHGGAFAVNRFVLAAAPRNWRGALIRIAVAMLYVLPPLLLFEIAAYEAFARNRDRISAWLGTPCARP